MLKDDEEESVEGRLEEVRENLGVIKSNSKALMDRR